MKRLWHRISLECHRQPGDTETAPWYAYPLTVVFIVGVYSFVQMADTAGF